MVLRKRGIENEYNAHMTTIMRDIKDQLNIVWHDVGIVMAPYTIKLIELSAQPFLLKRTEKQRPTVRGLGMS